VGDPTARGTNRLVGGGLTPGNVLFYGASVRRIVAQHPRSVAEAGDPAESDYQSDLPADLPQKLPHHLVELQRIRLVQGVTCAHAFPNRTRHGIYKPREGRR
jgi:hypothetical protein